MDPDDGSAVEAYLALEEDVGDVSGQEDADTIASLSPLTAAEQTPSRGQHHSWDLAKWSPITPRSCQRSAEPLADWTSDRQLRDGADSRMAAGMDMMMRGRHKWTAAQAGLDVRNRKG